MNALMNVITVEAYAGSRITTAIHEAIILAIKSSMEVRFNFNGVTISVKEDSSEAQVLDFFYKELGKE